MTEPMAPHYYLTNFRFLIDWVAECYSDLLDENERAFITCFYQLDHNSQCLLVRMIGRKGPWFRADKLVYADIDQRAKPAQALAEAHFITVDAALDIAALANILTKAELLQLFSNQLLSHKTQRKESLMAILVDIFPEEKTWPQWTNQQFGPLYRLEVQPIVSTLLLLFFGNAQQDLTEFVLQDLGLYRYENYSVDKHHRVFKTRGEIMQYQQLLLLREHLVIAEDIHALAQLALQLPTEFANAAMERRYARLSNQLAYEFERHGEIDSALQLYQQTALPPSRERQIRLLEKRGDYHAAWRLLCDLMQQPADEHELQVAERMAPRLAKKAGTHFNKVSPPFIITQQWVLPQLIDAAGDYLRVEEIARRHIDTPEAPCAYVENTLLTSLLGLWLWPEMFRSIDGAFANPFQHAPLDLYQADFQHNRTGLQQLWQLLDEQTHAPHIYALWQEKNGIANHLVHWHMIDEKILHMALTCIPAAHLKHIFQRLLFDLKANRSGLPDLIQFFPATHSYRMIEIKGPGDRIQDNQQRWLNFFSAHDIPAEVCYVSWQ